MTRRWIGRLTLLLPLTTLAAAPLAAQFCFRGRPLPACKSHAVTEFAIGARLREAGPLAENLLVASWELGALVNTSPRAALGGTLMAGFNGGGSRLALKGRYRRWLSPATAIDLAPGVVLAGQTASGIGELRAPGFSGHVGITWRGLVGAGIDVESVRYAADPDLHGQRATSVGVHARLGSAAGAAGGVVAAAVVVAYVIAVLRVIE